MMSQRARYAFKALLALSRIPVGESLQIKAVAEQENIPRSFLEHIMLDLKRHQLVGSRRGKDGGYFLLRAPSEITLGMVLRLIDGAIAPLPCLSKYAHKHCDDCHDETACALRGAFGEVYRATLSVIDRFSLAEAVERGEKAKDGLPVYGANTYSGAFI